MIYVVGPRDKIPEGAKLIDVTTRGKSPFSPMYHPTTWPVVAKRMENAWQFSKVYPEHEIDGKITEEWYEWRAKGLEDTWAHRYPMGKGKTPLYSYIKIGKWQRYNYIEAREFIYIPLYKNMLKNNVWTDVLKLKELSKTTDIALWDYDGYLTDDSFDTILNNPNKKMGHAFVLREVLGENDEP